MTAWEIDTSNTSKDYARAIRYRLKAKVDGVCITDRKELAPTSKVYCPACLAKHSERVRSYNQRKKDKLT